MKVSYGFLLIHLSLEPNNVTSLAGVIAKCSEMKEGLRKLQSPTSSV